MIGDGDSAQPGRQQARALQHIIRELGPNALVGISAAEHAGAFSACSAALIASQSRHWAASEAPQLPLPDCSHPDRCICAYAVQVEDR